MIKSELRKIYLAKQKALSSGDRARKSQQISDSFFPEFDLGQIKFLHCFIAIDKFNEIDTTLTFQRLWRDLPDIITVVPRIDRETGEMQNLRFSPDTELVKNVWGISEPLHKQEYVKTTAIDLVLVPLLCFDVSGHRIGYGKGFYDRFLAKSRTDCLKVGLSYFPPVENFDDTGGHDIRLDVCITPDRIYHFK